MLRRLSQGGAATVDDGRRTEQRLMSATDRWFRWTGHVWRMKEIKYVGKCMDGDRNEGADQREDNIWTGIARQ